jgi:hypothetical protein
METATIDTLRQNLDALGASDRNFAESLLYAANRRGLTERQAHWVGVLAERATTPQAQPEALNMPNILSMFNTATRNGLKRPAITFRCDNGTKVKLSLAGSRSRNAGAIYVTDGRPYGANTYYGKVANGVFLPSRDGKSILPTLRQIEAAPVEALAVRGRQSGACCYCSRELTDARSVTVGYGPICAEKWGLPWGG